MVLNAVLTRFVEKTPLTVMAHALMQRALAADWIDALFEKHRERQYTRELLFSSKVRVLDGNHLPASEKRLKPLRGSGAPRCRASRWWSTTRIRRW